jgi:cytochrome c-type biogenesis protein CcmH
MLLAAPPLLAIDPESLQDPVQQERYMGLIHELRCLKCQGETVADTPAMFAVDIRRQVREMVAEGRTDAEIRQYMVDRYGEIILLRPRSFWLWLTPGLFLVGGAFIGWRILRQRRGLLAADTTEVGEDDMR